MILNSSKLGSFNTTTTLQYGEYNGKVVDVKDPKKQRRIRVRVYGRTDKLPIDKLPWYQCISPINPSPNQQGGVPPVGSDVVVRFPDNSIYNGKVEYMTISVPPQNAKD